MSVWLSILFSIPFCFLFSFSFLFLVFFFVHDDGGNRVDCLLNVLRRRGGVMIIALVSGSSGPGSSPGQGHCVAFSLRHFTLTVPLSNQVCKWVPGT